MEGLTASDGSKVNAGPEGFINIFKCRWGKNCRSGEDSSKPGEWESRFWKGVVRLVFLMLKTMDKGCVLGFASFCSKIDKYFALVPK